MTLSMKGLGLHGWDVTTSEAVSIQESLSSRVIRRDLFTSIKHICGMDVSFRDGKAVACCVVMKFPELELVDQGIQSSPVIFPYIPGLLSFREIPALIPVLHALSVVPDLVIADGQGIAHARGLGLASHLGVLTGIPTIGCAKSKLIGSYEEPGPRKGDWEYLYQGDEVIGAVVRSRDSVKPLFVSIGHGITLHSAVHYILKCCITYRITEPIRYAHRLAGGIA